jgi:ribulose-phosphate 3-epimerase
VDPKLYLSILGYEEALTIAPKLGNSSIINKIQFLSKHVNGLHLDIIRPPWGDRPHFLPNTINKLIPFIQKTLYDVHIISCEPINIIDELILEGNPEITIQYEAFRDTIMVLNSLEKIRERGFSPGISVDISTPVEIVSKEIFDASDIILLMSVKVGRGGQKFNPTALKKIKFLRRMYPEKLLGVDGGINEKTGLLCLDKGVNRLVVGSKITSSISPVDTIKLLQRSFFWK